MSYPLDIAAQNAALDALLSRDTSGLPSSWEVALFNDHPAFGGTELTGYVRPILNADLTDWPAASGGLKSSIGVEITVTVASSDTAPYFLLIDAADSTTRWFVGRFTEEIPFDTVGIVAGGIPRIYWNTEGF